MANEMVKKVFYAPVVKDANGKVQVILSDTSIDRDEEVIGKLFLERAASDSYLPALVDHENKALGLVNEWVNKRVEKRIIDGVDHFALVAEPKWFMSNPLAKTIRNMIEKDGAPMGVSITAIPHEEDEIDILGKSHRRFVDGEILSADWVGIPSNRHAKALAIAKSFSFDKDEVESMDEKQIQEFSKTISESVTRSVEDSSKEFLKKKDVDPLVEMIKALSEKVDALTKSEGDELEEEKKKDEAPAEKDEAAKKASLEEASKKRAEALKELKKTPTSDDSDAKVVDDGDVGVGGFIKAYTAPVINE